MATDPQSAITAGSIPTNTPTVAETGVPVSAGKEGPGPASGSLAGGHKRTQSTASGPPGPGYGEAAPSYGGVEIPKYGLSDSGQPVRYESADEEKQRLQKEERDSILQGSTQQSSGATSSSVASAYTPPESAEDEKKRLEREERERCADTAAGQMYELIIFFFFCGCRVLRAESSQSSNDPGPGPELTGVDGDDGTAPPAYEEPQ